MLFDLGGVVIGIDFNRAFAHWQPVSGLSFEEITNAAHQAAWSAMFPELVQAFDRIFVSSDMGCRKPEQRAFEHIAREIGVDADAILFFDDLAGNLAGAAIAGLQPVHVQGPEDVRRALEHMAHTANLA